MKKLTCLILFPLALFSCKPDKKKMITKTWHAVAVDNPDMDNFFRQGQEFIDTVGNNKDPKANMELYGTNNIDSLRKGMQAELDSAKVMQRQNLAATSFTFRKDGVAVMSLSGNIDSSKWYFDDDGSLMLDEISEKGAGDKLKMDVVALADTVLKLKFTEDHTASTVTFRPGG